ncbi:unnamed protein product [Symbiodinium sp. CCMP2456]|nr:unnamed protein product [Symbiodinium sp. CCMP2456]
MQQTPASGSGKNQLQLPVLQENTDPLSHLPVYIDVVGKKLDKCSEMKEKLESMNTARGQKLAEEMDTQLTKYQEIYDKLIEVQGNIMDNPSKSWKDALVKQFVNCTKADVAINNLLSVKAPASKKDKESPEKKPGKKKGKDKKDKPPKKEAKKERGRTLRRLLGPGQEDDDDEDAELAQELMHDYLSGDWKYLRQDWHVLSKDASWRDTIGCRTNSPHKTGDIPLFRIPGLETNTIMTDPMHTFHLGWGQDLAASGLILLCRLQEFGNDRVLNSRLHRAYTNFVAYCVRGSNNDWPTSLGGKAYDTFLVLAWMEDHLENSVSYSASLRMSFEPFQTLEVKYIPTISKPSPQLQTERVILRQTRILMCRPCDTR